MALDPDDLTPTAPVGDAAPDPGATIPVTPVERDAAQDDEQDDELASDRRRVLWRDSATLLIGVILAMLAAQTFLPGSDGVPTGSPTPIPSGIAIGSLAPPVTLPPSETFGPIIDPSLGIDATPTPIPVITPGPTPTEGPTASPSGSPKPSAKPTTKPTPKPSAEATPPPPAAAFTWDVTLLQVVFTNTSTGDTSWLWDFGDGETSTGQNPLHTYLLPGEYVVKLTASGPGGPDDSATHNVNVTLEP